MALTINSMLIWAYLNFSEVALEDLKRAGAFVWVASPQIDNALRLWFPADDADGDPPAVFDPAVNFSRSLRPFSFIAENAPTMLPAGW